jgi:hypothetical protein
MSHNLRDHGERCGYSKRNDAVLKWRCVVFAHQKVDQARVSLGEMLMLGDVIEKRYPRRVARGQIIPHTLNHLNGV